jgi:hypothetical protein
MIEVRPEAGFGEGPNHLRKSSPGILARRGPDGICRPAAFLGPDPSDALVGGRNPKCSAQVQRRQWLRRVSTKPAGSGAQARKSRLTGRCLTPMPGNWARPRGKDAGLGRASRWGFALAPRAATTPFPGGTGTTRTRTPDGCQGPSRPHPPPARRRRRVAS